MSFDQHAPNSLLIEAEGIVWDVSNLRRAPNISTTDSAIGSRNALSLYPGPSEMAGLDGEIDISDQFMLESMKRRFQQTRPGAVACKVDTSHPSCVKNLPEKNKQDVPEPLMTKGDTISSSLPKKYLSSRHVLTDKKMSEPMISPHQLNRQDCVRNSSFLCSPRCRRRNRRLEKGNQSSHLSPRSKVAARSSNDSLVKRQTIEVSRGNFLELRGSNELEEALRTGDTSIVHCCSCSAMLQCISDCKLVICPKCRIISPVQHAGERKVNRLMTMEQKPQGASLVIPPSASIWTLDEEDFDHDNEGDDPPAVEGVGIGIVIS